VYTNWQQSDKHGLAKLEDLLNPDTYTEGGSTITQQLVKNIYLTPQKSFTRKIKELVFSYQLEKKYTKDQILDMYLNNIYYGQQALGIENASEIYFHTNVKDLDLAEASMLAGLPQAPSDYSPITNYNASKLRQQYVLQRMYLAGEIDLTTAREAANEPLTLYGTTQTVDKYPYFSSYVEGQLEKDLGTTDISDKGYKVYTSLDSSFQNIAQSDVTTWLKKLASRSATNAAVVIADPKTDEIEAMVGGADWNTSSYNDATAERQPGSSFKPIVYATALENGYTAATILDDKYVNFGGIPPYIPEDYTGTFSGMVTVRDALARSLNVPAVEMGKLVGITNVINMAHNLGITTINNSAGSYGLSLSLGSGEVKLVDMAEVYSTFANGGVRMPQTAINKIVDNNGNQIALPVRKGEQVLSPETAYILSSILSDNNARSATFGLNSPLKTTMTTAVKTGTTDSYVDSWTMGYSPSLVVGVWMGNNNNTAMDEVSGSEGAAYIWHDVITACLSNVPNQSFAMPSDIQEAWVSPYTGALATYQGKPNILEYFKPNTAPGSKVDLSYLKQF
jgi:membrane peptidoglycan carboxypeptidase